MEEEKVEVGQNGATPAGNPEIVIQEGKAKKILKWVVKGVVILATGIGGFFIGRASKNSDDETGDDEAESENPKEDD